MNWIGEAIIKPRVIDIAMDQERESGNGQSYGWPEETGRPARAPVRMEVNSRPVSALPKHFYTRHSPDAW